MSIAEEYREDVEELEKRLNRRIGRRAVQIRSSLDRALPFVGLLVLFIFIFGFMLDVDSSVSRYVTYANYAVISFFGLRLAVEFRLKSSDTSAQTFLENHWLDVLMTVPALSVLEEVEFAGLLESSLAARLGPEVTGFSIKGTSVAARLTKIARVLKRTVGI